MQHHVISRNITNTRETKLTGVQVLENMSFWSRMTQDVLPVGRRTYTSAQPQHQQLHT